MAAKKDQQDENAAVTPEQVVPDIAAVNEPTKVPVFVPAEAANEGVEARRAEPEYVVAIAPLFVGSAPAHQPGDRVPAENVERNGWQDKVRPLAV